jgi:hypothetical protein
VDGLQMRAVSHGEADANKGRKKERKEWCWTVRGLPETGLIWSTKKSHRVLEDRGHMYKSVGRSVGVVVGVR